MVVFFDNCSLISTLIDQKIWVIISTDLVDNNLAHFYLVRCSFCKILLRVNACTFQGKIDNAWTTTVTSGQNIKTIRQMDMPNFYSSRTLWPLSTLVTLGIFQLNRNAILPLQEAVKKRSKEKKDFSYISKK